MPKTIEGVVYYTEAELAEQKTAAAAAAKAEADKAAAADLQAAQTKATESEAATAAAKAEAETLKGTAAEKEAALGKATRHTTLVEKLVGAGYGYGQAKLLAELPALGAVDLAKETDLTAAIGTVKTAFPPAPADAGKSGAENLGKGGANPGDSTIPVANTLKGALAEKLTPAKV
jgi:hypothetical protein